MNLSMNTRTCLYDANALNAVLDRMALQALALVHGEQPTAVVGILRRGAPLADALTQRLVQRHGLPPPLRLDLSVRRYSDDLQLLYPETLLTEQAQHAQLDLTGHRVLLVDDVLYTGQSLLRVLPYLLGKQAASVQLACLVDRCTVQLPVQATVVGLRLAIAPTDIIECHVPPYEADFKIELVQRPGMAPACTNKP